MRIGIVGCGTVAQIMHVPHVVELPDAELVALADPVDRRVQELGDRYDVPGRFDSGEAMLDEAELDAVIVCTPMHHHADVVVDALESGVHALVEKPLAASLEDADRMVAAAENGEATAMVAYMKRYAPAYERAREVVADLDEIDLVTAYDVDPDHGRIIDEVYDVVGGAPPERMMEESRRKRRRDAMAAVGTDDSDLAADYNWHLEHVCHDVNLLRGLFGAVERIDHVDRFADGRYATAHLVYEDGIRCVLESGDSDRKWFEQFLRVDAPDGAVTLEYDNPFIRNSPAGLRVKRGTEDISDETYRGSYEEPFKRELRWFLGCVRGDREVRTTFAEAREDVRLIADLFRASRGGELLGEYAD